MSKLWLGFVKIATWICQWQEKCLTAIYRAGFAILAMFVERFDLVKSIPHWYNSSDNLGGMLWSFNAICCMMGATIVDRRWFQSLAKVLMKSAHWTINNGGQQLHRCFQVGPPPSSMSSSLAIPGALHIITAVKIHSKTWSILTTLP